MKTTVTDVNAKYITHIIKTYRADGSQALKSTVVPGQTLKQALIKHIEIVERFGLV